MSDQNQEVSLANQIRASMESPRIREHLMVMGDTDVVAYFKLSEFLNTNGYAPSFEQLAEMVGCSKANLSQTTVPNLETRGLVRVARDEEGHMVSKSFRLTPEDEIPDTDAPQSGEVDQSAGPSSQSVIDRGDITGGTIFVIDGDDIRRA